jgi:glycerol kinase
MLMNTGDKPVYSKNNFETTVAWKINGNYLCLRRKCICGGQRCNGCDGAKMIDSDQKILKLALAST